MKKSAIFLKGLIKENPVLVLLLGTCPTLATTTSVVSAIAMGLAATAVLFCSNSVISALRNIIPDKVRIPCYIVVIAGFVSIVQMVMQAYLPDLYDMLGVYLALIVVNCIILGRAEMFARKNTVVDSALDGLGMGLGFTIALLMMSTFREVLGAGTFAGISIPVLSEYNVPILTASPGGFFAFGVMMALVAKITGEKKENISCAACPAAEACGQAGAGCDGSLAKEVKKEDETNA